MGNTLTRGGVGRANTMLDTFLINCNGHSFKFLLEVGAGVTSRLVATVWAVFFVGSAAVLLYISRNAVQLP